MDALGSYYKAENQAHVSWGPAQESSMVVDKKKVRRPDEGMSFVSREYVLVVGVSSMYIHGSGGDRLW